MIMRTLGRFNALSGCDALRDFVGRFLFVVCVFFVGAEEVFFAESAVFCVESDVFCARPAGAHANRRTSAKDDLLVLLPVLPPIRPLCINDLSLNLDAYDTMCFHRTPKL